MILAEAPCYQAQRHPCYGVHPRPVGTDTLFSPWVHDGRVVRWWPAMASRCAALAMARRMAAATKPQA